MRINGKCNNCLIIPQFLKIIAVDFILYLGRIIFHGLVIFVTVYAGIKRKTVYRFAWTFHLWTEKETPDWLKG